MQNEAQDPVPMKYRVSPNHFYRRRQRRTKQQVGRSLSHLHVALMKVLSFKIIIGYDSEQHLNKNMLGYVRYRLTQREKHRESHSERKTQTQREKHTERHSERNT